MAKLHCLFGVRDDLHEFAESILFGTPMGLLNGMCQQATDYGDVHATVLHRDGDYQVELVCMQPGLHVPLHTHLGTDSIEYALGGSVRFTINGQELFPGVDEDKLMSFVKGKGLRIPNDAAHGGLVHPVLGATFLSFQRWSGPVMQLGDNYQGVAMSPKHAALMEG